MIVFLDHHTVPLTIRSGWASMILVFGSIAPSIQERKGCTRDASHQAASSRDQRLALPFAGLGLLVCQRSRSLRYHSPTTVQLLSGLKLSIASAASEVVLPRSFSYTTRC